MSHGTTDVIVVGPAVLTSDAIVVAGCRAGGRGFLRAHANNIGNLRQRFHRARSALDDSTSALGIALTEHSVELLGQLEAALGDSITELRALIVPIWAIDHQRAALHQLREAGVEILVEIVDRNEFARLGGLADGVILKGNESGGRVSATTAYVLSQQWCEFSRAAKSKSAPLPFWVRGGISALVRCRGQPDGRRTCAAQGRLGAARSALARTNGPAVGFSVRQRSIRGGRIHVSANYVRKMPRNRLYVEHTPFQTTRDFFCVTI